MKRGIMIATNGKGKDSYIGAQLANTMPMHSCPYADIRELVVIGHNFRVHTIGFQVIYNRHGDCISPLCINYRPFAVLVLAKLLMQFKLQKKQ